MYRTIFALPSTYTQHTLNPKALQGSVSSRAKSPSWGNPRGGSTLLPVLPLKSYWDRKSREQLLHHWKEDGGACFAHSAVWCCCPSGESEDGRGGNSDTGVFHDFARPQLRLSSCEQTHTHTVFIHTVVHPPGFGSTPHTFHTTV